ncbi:Exostosin family protein [Hirschfeldia incana]|nr:Exostosin family protein [Hirschfeldia incana]
MEIRSELRKLSRSGKRIWLTLVAVLALTHVLLLLSYGRYLLPDGRRLKLPNEHNALTTPSQTALLRNTLAVNVSAAPTVLENNGYGSGSGLRNEAEDDEGFVDIADFESLEDVNDSVIVKQVSGSNESDSLFPSEKFVMQNVSLQSQKNTVLSGGYSFIAAPVMENSTLAVAKKVSKKKKMRCDLPPKTVTTINEMNRILTRHRRSSRAMRPRWSSRRDEEMLSARKEIENAPLVTTDKELYPPIFRNISMFKRSYELMERILKVYVYKEGSRPIFHTPILKGLYASEGWFMKLMEGNKRYTVKDPRRAHLYYMPFSARMLEYKLYVRNSHNRTNLRQFLKEYTEHIISSKYPFFNRTGGADHFLVACHDWAPYETRHHMEHCIKALCNADVTAGFKIGRDISLPETYVRAAKNPLRDLGGKPPSQRRILAFYAGSMHGYLRTILLQHWKDKDSEMRIYGRMPLGVASKMNYIDQMKSSRYCLCPKGYEVNSPRVVESIFYECVPVIISDNFVPPFFEVLDWSAFSVIVAEKDIPRLKEILMSIPEEKYVKMQMAVRKAQRHFLWHAKPERYDLFHMVLHSICDREVLALTSSASHTKAMNSEKEEQPTMEIDDSANVLDLTSCQLHSLETIELPPTITELDLTANRLSELDSRIAHLSALKKLSLRQNLIEDPAVEPLSRWDALSDLEELILRDNKLAKVPEIGIFSKLLVFDVSFNEITSLQGLSKASNTLKELYVSKNEVNKIMEIEHLHDLQILELGSNRLRVMENMENFTKLDELWLGRNRIKVVNLCGLRCIKKISLQSNRLTCMKGFEDCVALEELYLSHNGISKMEGLSTLVNLRVLDVSNNKLTSVDDIQNLTKLEDLWLNDNQIESLEEITEAVVGSKEKLTTIYLENNPCAKSSDYVAVLRQIFPNVEQIDSNLFA